MILVIDNVDSFVHNVARHFELLGMSTRVVRNDALDIAEIRRLRPDAIVVSPGPCAPAQAGISNAVFSKLSGEIPILGVCLGHQCMGEVFGGRVVHAKRPLHGQAADIRHTARGLFARLPQPLAVGRYHSLVVEPSSAMEAVLTVEAWSQEGEIMALAHKIHPTWGVQFHPESILTPFGLKLLENFLVLARARQADAVA